MHANSSLLDFIPKLRRNYKTAVILNANKLGYEITKAKKLYSNFDVSIVSCEVGMMKPEKEIFELALKKLNRKAEECVLIDDRAEQLETPAKMGFKVIHFKNNEQLIADLKLLEIAV